MEVTALGICDGMSCAQIALRQLGIPVGRYYASETDKFAIAQTQLNFPNTIQLGDMEHWREWNIDWGSIDIIFAGTPCQGFSSAGKGLNFDDPRSRLFFVFIDILNHVRRHNPNVKFFLENVNMKKAWLGVISKYCGVFPVFMNSTLVSAQNRERWYWSNIRTKEVGLFNEIYTDIPQPEDRNILLKDILEEEVDEKYYVSDTVMNRLLRTHKNFTPKVNPSKTGTLTTGNNSAKMAFDGGTTFVAMRVEGKARTVRVGGGSTFSNKHNCNLIQLNPSTESNGCQPYQQNRVYDIQGKAPACMAELSCGSYAVQTARRIRRLTPTECARLQTIPGWYRWECSDTQVYKMLGNGWTVDAIAWILSFWNWESKKI